ncbi:MAG: cysteine synthase family protein [Acidimicrobiia bacterium]|nr:cysteine synthase family protein [Acidimicrobiia bacterium]
MNLRRYGIVPTPVVRLDEVAPEGIALYAKCEWHLPTGSVKDRIAAAMVDSAGLRPGDRVLEPSSGNTGIALARLAALGGFQLSVMVPDNVSRERIDLLGAYGAEIIYSPGAEGSNGAVRRSEELARSGGYLMLHQYENPANPGAHELTTGPEIVDQVGHVDAFVATLGTGGTLMGVGAVLKREFGTRVIAAEPPAGELISGLRSLDDGYVPPVFDPGRIDGKLLVRTEQSIEMARRLLAEEGLFVGPSSGAAVHAAVKVASGLPAGSVVVTLLPDAGWKYLSTGIFAGSPETAADRVEGVTLW